MLTLPPSVRIYMAVDPVDLRRGHDGLAALVRAQGSLDLYAGHLFVFLSRRRDRCKILFFDRGGFVLYYKRLERGRFRAPHVAEDGRTIELDATALAMLLDGIDVAQVQRARLWKPANATAQLDRSRTTSSNQGVSRLPQDHFCPWREEAERLQTQLSAAEERLVALERRVFGRRSEKMPPMDREVRRGTTPDPARSRATRAARAAARETLVTELISHRVHHAERVCAACGRDPMPAAGTKVSTEYEFVAGYFRRRLHHRETLACSCGATIVTAPAPDRVGDGTHDGPGFIAHLIVAKCADAIPLYRLETAYRREGVPIARSTMTDLFHRGAERLAPLADRILARVAASPVVQADETTIRLQTSTRRAYLWTFLADRMIAYRFSLGRSGETPRSVLGGTRGALVVDAYTGYNRVATVEGRVRVGCLAHARRKFFDALSTAPEARFALDPIREVYTVEHQARERGLVRTPAHLALRQSAAREAMTRLETWLHTERPKHPPKSPLGRAIGYALEQWIPLTRFLDDVALPPDNNRSENALRAIALGRKNFLFVGHEEAGRNLAVLYTLVATCVACGVNPLEYLRDVLIRVQSHPATRIDELLPDRWRECVEAAATATA